MADGDKEKRIIEAALELAEGGGFDAVRQREVAARAGVALGTLYKRFRGKNELLIGALEYEMDKLDRRLKREPPKGDTILERVHSYFGTATHYFVRKPNFGRAVLKAAAGMDRSLAERMLAYQARQHDQIVSVLSTPPSRSEGEVSPEQAVRLATLLLQVWFAALVGWSGGLYRRDEVVEQVMSAAELGLRGIHAR